MSIYTLWDRYLALWQDTPLGFAPKAPLRVRPPWARGPGGFSPRRILPFLRRQVYRLHLTIDRRLGEPRRRRWAAAHVPPPFLYHGCRRALVSLNASEDNAPFFTPRAGGDPDALLDTPPCPPLTPEGFVRALKGLEEDKP